MLELLLTVCTGTNNRFINPGVVLKIDDNSYIGLKDSTFVGDLSTLAFISGSTNTATSVVFQNFQLIRAFTVDVTAAWQDICPDGSLYEGIVSFRYIGNGASDAFTKTVRLTGKNAVLTLASTQSNAVGGVDPNPGALRRSIQRRQAPNPLLPGDHAGRHHRRHVPGCLVRMTAR